MNRNARAAQHHWLAAGLIGITGVAFVAVLFRAPASNEIPRRDVLGKSSGLVRVTTVGDANAALTEEALLFDPTPLFLPTEWNAAQNDKNARQIKAAHREPGNVFAAFQPKLVFNDLGLDVGIADPMPPVENSTKYLVESASPPLVGFGREKIQVSPLAARGAYVSVRNTSDGRMVYRSALDDARPPGDGLWQPIEMDASIDPAGLVGSLVVSRPSDVEGIDDYFRRYLAESRHLGQILAPGFYHLVVGP